MASSDPRGAVSASTPNSPGAPAESPVARRTVRESGRVRDGVHTRQTTAAHAAQDRSRTDPPGTTPSRGPERVRRRVRPAPLPRQGPAAGTMSLVLSRPPRAPRSHPVKPGATVPGVGEGTTATGKPTGAPRATVPDEERRTTAGPRGTPERHTAGHNHGTRTGAKPQLPPGAANPGSAHNTRRTAARDKVPRTAGPPRPHTAPTASGKRAPAARPKGRVVGGGRAPDPGRSTPRQEDPPPGTLMPPPQHPRARAVGLLTGPHARIPRTDSQWVVGPGRKPEQMRGRGWESARPRTPHTQARGAPPGHPHAGSTARKSARCGVGDGSPRPHPPHPQPVGSRPRPHARTDERSGVGEHPSPDAPHPGKRRPPGALVPPPQRAKPARKSARCGVGDGSPCPHPPHPQPVGSGPRSHARTDERSGLGERPSPDAPHPGKRRPPWESSCRPRTHTPAPAARGRRTPTARPVGGQSGEGKADLRRPSQRWKAPPRGRPSATPTASDAGPQGRTLWGRCWVPTPAPTAPETHGAQNPGRPPQRAGGRGRDSA